MTQFYNSAGASHHGTRFLLYRGILERKGGKGKKKSLQSRSKITPILKEDTNLGQKDCSLQWTPRNFSSKRFTGIYQPSPGQVRRIGKKEKQPAFSPQLSQPIFYNCRSSSECGQTFSIQRYSTVHCSLCSSVPPLAAGVGSHCTNGLCITWEGCCAPYTQHQQISRKSQVKMWNKPKIMPPSYERNSQTVKPKIASTGQVQREKQNATTLCGHLWFWNDNVNPGPSVQWDDPPCPTVAVVRWGLQRSLSELISVVCCKTSFLPFPLCIAQCSFWCFRSHRGHWSLPGEVSKLLIKRLLTQKVSQPKFWSRTHSHTKQGCQIGLQGVSLPNSNLRLY